MSSRPLGRRLGGLLRARAPWLYQPLRRAYALAEYAATRRAAGRSRAGDAYGEPFWDLHADASWDWAGFAMLIHRYTKPRRVVDVGCGDAKILAALASLDPGLALRGYDGSPEAQRRAAARGVAVWPLDLASIRPAALAAVRADCATYDTAVCLEVAEHLLPWHAGRLLSLLTACDTVVFSAAHPGQGGTLHVNERPLHYWVARFAERGYVLRADDAAFGTELAALSLPPWYAQNAHLFGRRRAVDRRPAG